MRSLWVGAIATVTKKVEEVIDVATDSWEKHGARLQEP